MFGTMTNNGSRNSSAAPAEKEALMRQIDQASFAMDDVLLYLDTHPTDQEALNYYHHAAGLRREAMEPGRHSMVLFWLTLSKIWTAGPG